MHWQKNYTRNHGVIKPGDNAMSFGRWLLVHSFSLFLLALIILLYLFRSELLLDQAYRQLLSLDPVPVTALSKNGKKPVKAEKSPKATRRQPSTPTYGNKHRVTQKRPVASSEKPATHPDLVAVPTVKGQAAPQPKRDADLMRARQAYWDKDYHRAISEYRRLIEQNKDNPDYLGELGNVYYTLNDDQRAAQMYYQAAMLFIQHRQPQHARSLLAPITALNRELGDRLKSQLNH